MFLRIVAMALALVVSTSAQGQMRFGRMTLACAEDQGCVRLVGLMKSLHDEYFATAGKKGWGVVLDELRAFRGLRDILERRYPGVWQAQNCPLGDCRPVLSPSQTQELRKAFKQ